MLIASVLVYFLSYAPTQVPLFYNLFSSVPFSNNWSFLVFIMVCGYVNSAANPILYIIFSQKFRHKFFYILITCLRIKHKYVQIQKPGVSEYSCTANTEFTTRGGNHGNRYGVHKSETQMSALMSESG